MLRRFFLNSIMSILAAAAGLHGQGAGFSGRVIDENGRPIPGAIVSVSGESVQGVLEASSDEAGRFALPQVNPGKYDLRVRKVGYYALVANSFEIRLGATPVDFVLNHQQEFEETVSVIYSAPAIDHQETAVQTTLNSDEIKNLPFPASHDFRNALPLIPGVVKDNRGRIHLNGGAENQAHYTLDGFNVSSPASGILENRISVDAIRSARIDSSRYSVESGKGSAGVMSLETARGDDRFRVAATNFFPSFEDHGGFAISNWNPRGSVSGPIIKGRAWYSDTMDLQYDRNIVDSLPRGANQSVNWSGSNRSLVQVNLSATNLLTVGFLTNFFEAAHSGITSLDPMETTRSRKERFHFFSLKEQAYLPRGWVIEAGLGINRLRGRERPMGNSLYVVTPFGRSGNYFLDSESRVRRTQVILNFITPYLNWRGRHSFKFGMDGNEVVYSRWSDRHAVEFRRWQGTRSRRVEYGGGGNFRRNNTEYSTYVQDRWSPREGVQLEAGLRLDWDGILRTPLWSPRVGVTLFPKRFRGAKLSAGVGVFYDAASLGPLSNVTDVERTDLFFAEDGTSILKGPVRSRFIANERDLEAPFHLNWSVGWEQELARKFIFRSYLIRRHGRHGWAYDLVSAPDMNAQALYGLSSHWHERYFALELTITRTFADKYPWLVSYTRSSAHSDAVLDFSPDNLLLSRQGRGPLDWDAPNRLISWGFLPAPYLRRFSLAYFLEWRSGFPYGIVDDLEQRIGAANSERFPDYFSLNLHLERRFRLWRTQWALRAGFNNITDSRNPVVVNNNITSPRFRECSGGQGRVFTSRIRFLGKS